MARFRLLPALLAFGSVTALAFAASAQTLTAGPPRDTFDLNASWATGLTQLTDFRFLPDGRVVALSKTGQVRVRTAAGAWSVATTFDVDTESEKGLLGIEVHPSFATNKTLFLYYSAADSIGGTDLDRHRIVSVVLKDDNTIDKSSEKILVRGLRGPANHDGGGLSIGPDGKLYIGVGDTGCNCSCAPGGANNYFSTCFTVGNGKILRVNLDGTIPADNPLQTVASATACGSSCTSVPTGTAAPRKDIWAWGFRNPFRVWADPVTGLLWVGDVGEITWEEINVVQKGKHYGWPYREGAAGKDPSECTKITPNVGNCVDPVYACPRSDCHSITGGLIVDSCTWPTTFRGLYFFADYSQGKVWTLQPNAARDGVVSGSRKEFASINGITSFGAGPDGALYMGALGAGRIYRVSPKSPLTCPPPDAGPGDTGPGDTGAPPADSSIDDTGTPSDTSVEDTGGATDSAIVPDTGGNDATPGTEDSGGCGCELPGRSAPRHSLAALALAAIGAVLARRRR